MICGHLWQTPASVGPATHLTYLVWEQRCHQLIPDGLETTDFSASRIFAAVYPEAVLLASLFASPTWRRRKRQPGNVILHHRHIRPVLIRDWSRPMQELRGAIWQSQHIPNPQRTEFAEMN